MEFHFTELIVRIIHYKSYRESHFIYVLLKVRKSLKCEINIKNIKNFTLKILKNLYNPHTLKNPNTFITLISS